MSKISVVTPTFNRRESLRTTIEGLARQSYPVGLFEHVVVSDGSTDGTEAMVKELSHTTPFDLRCIVQDNSGPAAARNRGIREATNDIVVFLDDDVEPLPEFLARHALHHEEDDRAAVIGPMSPDPMRSPSEPIWITWEHVKLQDIYNLFIPGGPLEHVRPGPMHFYSGNASVRRQHLLDSGGFDEAFMRQEDVELAVRLERDSGVRFVFDRDANGLHRPTRSFESWLNIPSSYGRLDAKRLEDGSLPWERVEYLASTRNPITRLISDASVASPATAGSLNRTLKAVATSLAKMGATGAALSALSALYNSVYSQCLHAELQKTGWLPASARGASIEG